MNQNHFNSVKSQKPIYPVDYQKIKKESSLIEGHSYFYEWIDSHLEGERKSLLMSEINSFEKVFAESASNSRLDTEHHFSKSLANALYHSAKDALSQNQPLPAVQLFYALSHLVPNNYDVFLGLGLAFQSQGNFTDSVEAFKHAISIHPQTSLAYLYIAESYLNLGDIDKFNENIAESERLIPKDDRVLHRHVQFLLQQSKSKRG